MKKAKRRIGVFGGSFNPPHIGHFSIITQCLSKGFFDLLLVCPNNCNPLKKNQPQLTPTLRAKMIRATFGSKAFANFLHHHPSGFAPNQVILDWFDFYQPKTTFTINSLKRYRRIYPKDELYLIIGNDLTKQIVLWKDYQKIPTLASYFIVQRQGCTNPCPANPALQTAPKVDLAIPQISSSELLPIMLKPTKTAEQIALLQKFFVPEAYQQMMQHDTKLTSL